MFVNNCLDKLLNCVDYVCLVCLVCMLLYVLWVKINCVLFCGYCLGDFYICYGKDIFWKYKIIFIFEFCNVIINMGFKCNYRYN